MNREIYDITKVILGGIITLLLAVVSYTFTTTINDLKAGQKENATSLSDSHDKVLSAVQTNLNQDMQIAQLRNDIRTVNDNVVALLLFVGQKPKQIISMPADLISKSNGENK